MVLAEKVNNRFVNRRALRRYQQFWTCLQDAAEAVHEAEKLIAKADDSKRISWSAAKPDELKSAAVKAGRLLQTLSKSGKKWEAELVAREWTR
jgi:hypothetical protein